MTRGQLASVVLLAGLILSTPLVGAPDCPSTPRQWDRWRQRISTDLVRAMKKSFTARNLVENAGPVVDNWNRCGADVKRAPVTVQACLKNLSTYAGALSLRTVRKQLSGYRIPDADYHRKADVMTAVPAELLAPSLLDDVTRFGGLAQAKSYLRALNQSRSEAEQLVFFSFKSQHLGTPDNDDAYGRLLVVVPGNPEKWVQYGVPEFVRQPVMNVSVVAVEKRADGTRHVYFKDRALVRSSDGNLVPKGRFELGANVDACMDCHKGGVNPIFPAPGSVSADELPLVDKVNQRFRTHLPPSFDGNYDPAWFGPGLGTRLSPRAGEASDVVTQRVRRALKRHGEPASAGQVNSVAAHVNCAKCHEPGFLQPLNAPLNEKLVSSYLLGGKMPPKAELTLPERKALLDAVVDDYFSVEPQANGILMAWLLEGRCTP